MGTSSSNSGPSGISSLLPSWYNSPPEGSENSVADSEASDGHQDNGNGSENVAPPPYDQNDQTPNATPNRTENWKDAKGSFTRYTRSTAGANIRKAARSYVRTLGGTKGATRSASRGISVGAGFASFLGSAATAGIDATLTSLGLTSFIGRSSEEILAKIADSIAPSGATNEEAIARDAIIATLDSIYTGVIENGGDITSLETLTPDMIAEAVVLYVSVYIFKKWVYELGVAVEKNTVSEKHAIEMEIEIKDFVFAEVQLAMQGKTLRDFDLNSEANQQIIESIFDTAYSTIQQ
jgi:hypothetical protein